MVYFTNISNLIESIGNQRNNLLKDNNTHISILIYFTLLFTIDYSGVMDFYGQNIIRRCINMLKRVDPLSYYKKLKPWCVKYDKMLNDEDIKKMQSIKIPETKDFGIFTRKNTTTHQLSEKYSENEKNIILEISEKLKKEYETKIGKKLYNLKNNKPTIYRYHGNNSHHLWHVDPQNISEIYNIIVCIKKKGNISPLQYKNNKGEECSIHFEEGDAALFNGGTTVHQVPPNDDEKSERTVLSIAFTSDERIANNPVNSNNLCTFIEGGNNYVNLLKIAISMFVINFILANISGIYKLSYKFIFIFFACVLLISKYVPYYLDIGLGSGRASSIYYNMLILVMFLVGTISIKGAMVMFSYFLLGDVFFSRKWVEYD